MYNTELDTTENNTEPKGVLNYIPKALILGLINKELREKERDVIIRRFGLKGKQGETLEQIGRRRGVTRERVRQIEKSSINKLRKSYLSQEDIVNMEKIISQTINEHGGLMEESYLLKTLLGDNSEYDDKQAILFGLNHLFDEPNLVKDHPHFHDSWHLPKFSLDDVINVLSRVEEKINQKAEVIDHEVLQELLSDIEIEKKHLFSYINATKRIQQNNFGQWGLTSWSTVSPKRVGDKVYLVMKKANKHLHFKEITDLINTAGFDGGRTVNEGTVHNELIMDDRYILIGRGVYALKEWGYNNGTVSDVIVQLLKDKGAMHRQDIVQEVAKQRLVKENTIKVSLMNKNLFKRVGKQLYGLSS